MQLPLTYYSLGVTISFCKFWFENDTLKQVKGYLLKMWHLKHRLRFFLFHRKIMFCSRDIQVLHF